MPKKKLKIKIDQDLIISDGNYDKVLIFSHGLGDEPSSWIFFANEIKNEIKNIKIILTKAPNRSVSVNNGMEMSSWFDIKKIPIEANNNENYEYIQDSVNYINNIIFDELNKDISPNKIFLGGFSQGASLSLICGLNYEIELGGIMMFSGWLLKNHLNFENLNKINSPIFIGHGTSDNVVKYENTKVLYDLLDPKMSKMIFKTYDNMNHSVSMRERYDSIKWLKNIIY